MKYLRYQREFKLDNKLVEGVENAFGNDITWGGSLLGRLINSTFRKMKIGYEYTKVKSLVNRLEQELEDLFLKAGLNENDQNAVANLSSRMILKHIYEISTSNKDIKEKLDLLLGKDPILGLVESAIEQVEKTKIPNKDELVSKLKKFKNELIPLRKEEPKETKSEEEDENKPMMEFYQNSKSLLQIIIKIHNDIKENKVKIKQDNDQNQDTTKQSKQEPVDQQQDTTKQNKQEPVDQQQDTTKQNSDEFDVEADKRAREESKKLGISQNASYKYKFINENSDETDVNLEGNEHDAKVSWNKVVSAYNKSGLANYIQNIQSLLTTSDDQSISDEEKKIVHGRIITIGKQIVINLMTIGKPISFEELIKERPDYLVSINDQTRAISLFSKYILAFSEDMGLLGSFGETGTNIKTFITCFSELKKLYPNIKNIKVGQIKESIITKYKYFTLIKENEDVNSDDEDDEVSDEVNDEVKSSWFKVFKKGDEEKWVIDEKDTKLRDNIENEENNIDIKNEGNGSKDHIIAIINIFGKAYDLYATDLIPSGRPGGRVSQKTLREYEYIGKNKPDIRSTDQGLEPGFGPWAAKSVYNKWQEGVTKILENKKWRKILANSKFVSEAESSTDTSIGGDKKPGSGKTLLTFINAMLDNNEGDFKKHRKKIIEDYFGADATTITGKLTGGKDERANRDIIVNPTFTEGKIPDLKNIKNKIFKVKTKNNEIYFIYGVNRDVKDDNYVLFKYQETTGGNTKQSIVTDYLRGQKNSNTDDIDKYDRDMKYYFGGAKITGNEFRSGGKFTFYKRESNPVSLTKKEITIDTIKRLNVDIDPKIIDHNRISNDFVSNPKINKELVDLIKNQK